MVAYVKFRHEVGEGRQQSVAMETSIALFVPSQRGVSHTAATAEDTSTQTESSALHVVVLEGAPHTKKGHYNVYMTPNSSLCCVQGHVFIFFPSVG